MSRVTKLYRFLFCAAGAALPVALLLVFCTKDNPTSLSYEDDTETWTMTIDVLDGAVGTPLQATVKYTNREGLNVLDTTDAQGHIVISGNAAGTQSFYIAALGATAYTKVVVSETGEPDQGQTNPDKPSRLLDRNAVVKLFPLTGALSGSVKTRVNRLHAAQAADSVVVTLTYNNADMANATPQTFSTVTDANGVFSFANLPVAAGLTVAVANKSVNLVDYKADAFTQPVLAAGQTIPMGTIQMSPVNANQFTLITSATNIVVGVTDNIILQYTEDVDSLSTVTLENTSSSGSVAVTTTISGRTITVDPVVSLTDGSQYTLRAYVSGAKGGDLAALAVTVTAQGGGLSDVVSSNILDANKRAIGGFGLGDTLIFTFRDSVTSATASVAINGTPISVVVTQSGPTVKVAPVGTWKPTNDFDLTVSANLKDGTAATLTLPNMTTAGALALVSSNVMQQATPDAPWTPVNGLGYNQPIKIKINQTVASASATLTDNDSKVVPVSVVYGADTVQITPMENLLTGTPYSLSYTIKSTANQTQSGNVAFTTAASRAYVAASNVLGTDGIGLRNVPITTTLWYKMSDSVSIENLNVTLQTTLGVPVPNVVTVVGDTIKVDPVYNLAYNTTYEAIIRGKTKGGEIIYVDLTATSKEFKTQLAVYVVATNTRDAHGHNAVGFSPYGQMWVKFSENLDTDVSKIIWSNGAAATDLYGDVTSNSYNASVRISGDTLFVTPLQSRVQIPFAGTVGFQVNVLTAAGGRSGDQDFVVTVTGNDLYVKYTNTKNADGSMKVNFGPLDTIVVVSSKQLSAVTGVSAGDLGGGAPPDLTLDNVRLAATGDTIWYIPTVRMAVNTQYSIDFDVRRADGNNTGTTDALDVTWKTDLGVRITSVNNRQSGLFRPFKVIGDSLVVTFSKAIDTTKTFSVNNFVAKYTVAWSADGKTATIKNTDTLTAGGFAALPYTDGAATRQYDNLNFTLTTADGESKASLVPDGDNLDIHVEQGLWVNSTSYIAKVDANSPVSTSNGSAIDTIAADANLTVVFNRALDTNAIKADAANLYNNVLTLHKHGSTVLLDFDLTFSSDAKTLTINPKQNLENGVAYAVSFKSVPAGLGSANNFAGAADADNSLINGKDFEVKALPIVNIAALKCSLIVDTNTATDRRKGYSPAAGSYAGDVADNTMIVKIKEAAWNAGHQDSVTHYQFRYRKQGSASWYVDANIEPSETYSAFHSPQTLALNEWNEATVLIDVAYQEPSYMLTRDKDGTAADYLNGDHWLNSGTVVELQARPVFDSDNDGDLTTGKQSYGAWSTAVSFADDIAPGDSTFGIAGVTQADDENMDGTSGDAIVWDNFTGNKDTVGIIVTFPEDMDVTYTTVPTITFYDGVGTSETDPVKLSTSRWISGRQYLFAIEIPAGANYDDEVEFRETAEGATTNWVLNGGTYAFIFDKFASKGPNATSGTLSGAGIYNGAKVIGPTLNSNGKYSEVSGTNPVSYTHLTLPTIYSV